MERLLLTAAASLLAALALADDSAPVCATDDAKWEDCNRCVCNETGQWICTENECPGSRKDSHSYIGRSDNFQCAPNSIFKKRCFFRSDGNKNPGPLRITPIQPQATEEKQEMSRPRNASPRLSCIPNSHFKQDCNWCTCTEDGMRTECTRAICRSPPVEQKHPGSSADAEEARTQVCVPSTSFKEDCNTCVCSEDGLSAVCTLMLCDGMRGRSRVRESRGRERDFSCEPNTTFKIACNTCHCSSNGQITACTKMGCGNLNPMDFNPSPTSPNQTRNKSYRAGLGID